MPDDALQRLVMEVAELRIKLANMIRVGPVTEVQKDKVRATLAPQGGGESQSFDSPWLHTANHRAGARERRFYKKGQNIAVISPNGDFRQGMIMPWAENNQFPAPDHANDTGQDEETYQLEDLRVKKTKDGYDIWLEAPKQQNQGGQTGGGQDSQAGGGQQQSQARMKLRLNNDGGITARIGSDVRMSVHTTGAKIKHKIGGTIFVDDKGCWSTKEIQVKQDPIPDDDE